MGANKDQVLKGGIVALRAPVKLTTAEAADRFPEYRGKHVLVVDGRVVAAAPDYPRVAAHAIDTGFDPWARNAQIFDVPHLNSYEQQALAPEPPGIPVNLPTVAIKVGVAREQASHACPTCGSCEWPNRGRTDDVLANAPVVKIERIDGGQQ